MYSSTCCEQHCLYTSMPKPSDKSGQIESPHVNKVDYAFISGDLFTWDGIKKKTCEEYVKTTLRCFFCCPDIKFQGKQWLHSCLPPVVLKVTGLNTVESSLTPTPLALKSTSGKRQLLCIFKKHLPTNHGISSHLNPAAWVIHFIQNKESHKMFTSYSKILQRADFYKALLILTDPVLTLMWVEHIHKTHQS